MQDGIINKRNTFPTAMDYLKYYDLERYLFEDVHRRFHEDGCLDAFDFFSVIAWKANRAKSKIAKTLRERALHRSEDSGLDPNSLDSIARCITASLHATPHDRERLRLLFEEWWLRLPTASAILTVLWPNDFTVYDSRVCEQLGDDYDSIAGWSNFERVWGAYRQYMDAVRQSASSLSLRDVDRYLWGKSQAMQLEKDIRSGFADAGVSRA